MSPLHRRQGEKLWFGYTNTGYVTSRTVTELVMLNLLQFVPGGDDRWDDRWPDKAVRTNVGWELEKRERKITCPHCKTVFRLGGNQGG